MLFRSGGYLITNIALFVAITHFFNRTGKEQIADFRGLAETNPYLALVIAAGFFSLAGMPLLVGFFLAGLVIHGGLQGWWIQPVLTRLSELPLFISAAVLTSFNDNALITFLATLVPDMTDALKRAVVQGAVTGGGLTVIANAPNPAGQALLARLDRKSTRLNSSHMSESRMPSSA